MRKSTFKTKVLLYIIGIIFSLRQQYCFDSKVLLFKSFAMFNHPGFHPICSGFHLALRGRLSNWASVLFLTSSWWLLQYELYFLHNTYMLFLNEPTLAQTCTFLLNPCHKWLYLLRIIAQMMAGVSLATENIIILSLLLRFCKADCNFHTDLQEKFEA